MARVLPPSRLRKLARKDKVPVADHGVFRVERITYESLPRDVFVFAVPDWVNVVAETPEKKLVVVWQLRFGSDALSLEVPGGVIDAGEDPVAAAKRELREETGYEAESYELVSVCKPNSALQNNACYTVLARGARLAHETEFDELEDLEVALVDVADVAPAIDDGTIDHALVIVALEQYLRRFRS